jgi:hypothetical protein
MPSLPAGWSSADICFLIARVKEWPIVMVDDPALGIPCLKEFPSEAVTTDEYGVTIVDIQDCKLNCYLTPLPSGVKRWSHVYVTRGSFPYDKESVLKRLASFGGGPAKDEPFPPKEPESPFILPEETPGEMILSGPPHPEAGTPIVAAHTLPADDLGFDLFLTPTVTPLETELGSQEQLPPSPIDLSEEFPRTRAVATRQPGVPEDTQAAALPTGESEGDQSIVYEWTYINEHRRLMAVGNGTVAVCPSNRMRQTHGAWQLYYKINFLAVSDPKTKQPFVSDNLEELAKRFEGAFGVKVVLQNVPGTAVEIPIHLEMR